MEPFLKHQDALAELINREAIRLYELNRQLPLDEFQLPGISDYYFKKNHNARPYFSLQTAAELLYRSIKEVGKPVSEIILMDYGAGVGNLYLLAKLIGCKMVIYNDIVEDMTKGAEIIAKYLNIHIDKYITADHLDTLKILAQDELECDIILSRNVVEHIYDLQGFYADMYRYQPKALLYFSTTANFHNPANRLYHIYLHRKFEKEQFAPRRKEMIQQWAPQLKANQLNVLTAATRGLAGKDLEQAVHRYLQQGELPDPGRFGTNACDPENGMWIENLLTINQYRQIIEPVGYELEVKPAFWDTHYTTTWKNWIGKTFNTFTKILGNKGIWTTAFIYLIARPSKRNPS